MESSSFQFSAERLRLVNITLQRCYELAVPSDKAIRESIVKLIQATISDKFGREIEVRIYGSCAMGLQLRHSDIDVTVVLPDAESEKLVVLKAIECALTERGIFRILRELVWLKLDGEGTKGEFLDAALEMYKNAVEQMKADKPFDRLCIGELVHDVLCIIPAFTTSKKMSYQNDVFEGENHHFSILDPFSWEDKGWKVTSKESKKLQNRFAEAARILRQGDLADLFSFGKAYKYLSVSGPGVMNRNTRQELPVKKQDIDGEIAVIMMQEGRAEIFLIGTNATITCCRSEASIPRKHGPDLAYYERAWSKFFEVVAQDCLKYIDFENVRCAIIGSPGFTKDQFHRYLMEADGDEFKAVVESKSRIFLVHTTSGYKHSLREILLSPDLPKIISDARAVQEARALEEFFTMLSIDPNCACYGAKHVEVAFERMAVHTLLITDVLFRSSDKKYVTLVNSVKDSGGTAHILSSLHASGEQLAGMTGIAAILSFPLPELDNIEM